MPMSKDTVTFTATVVADEGGRVLVPLPFDPATPWGNRPRHHVSGTVNSMGVRAVIERLGDGFAILLGPAWRRDCGVDAGDTVTVELSPEGPNEPTWPTTYVPRSTPTPMLGRSGTPWRRPTATPTSGGSTPPNATPTNARRASPR